MADLIDRQALLKELRADYKVAQTRRETDRLVAIGIKDAMGTVADAPTVDAQSAHGKWLVWEPPEDDPHLGRMTPSYYCSVCQKNAAFVVDGIEPIPPQLFNRLIYRYCPHCGAKMDGEAKP